MENRIIPVDELPEDLVIEDYGIVDIRCYGGSPVEINGPIYELIPEVTEWLKENCPNSFFHEEEFELRLHSDHDAMMFKLRWL